MMDPELKQKYNPKSHYQTIFPPRDGQPVFRPGMAVPARIFPKLPPAHMNQKSVSQMDFIEKPLNSNRILHKPSHAIRTPGAPFDNTTSYKSDYYEKIFDPNPMASSLMRVTLPKIIEVQPDKNYSTTNESMMKKWSGNLKSEGYKELQEEPFFTGEFQGESVTMKTFGPDAVKGGRPRSTCKISKTRHIPEGSFQGNTTAKEAYKLPVLTEKSPLCLRSKTKTQQETMVKPKVRNTDFVTHYMKDNSGLLPNVPRRGMCPPHPDKLQLFRGPFKAVSEQKASYFDREADLTTTISNKNMQVSQVMVGGKFYDSTSTGVQFQPVSDEVRVAGVQEAGDVASRVTFDSKNGEMMKKTQHFGGKFSDKTVNQTEYFQFWETNPRVRHGDHFERVYHPSQAKFHAESETKSSFHPTNGKPSEMVKSLETRFRKGLPQQGGKMLSSDDTSYNREFIPRPIPKVNVCPAQVLVQLA